MYKQVLSLFIAVFVTSVAMATTHTILVGNAGTNTFSPDSINVFVGDTMKFVHASGSHTTTSDTIPTGASPWSIAISTASTQFNYVVTQPGCYHYRSTAAGDSAMTGVFCAAINTAVNNIDPAEVVGFTPNPSTSLVKVHVTAAEAMVQLYDITGRNVTPATTRINNDITMPVAELPSGMYLLTIKNGEATSMHQLVIAR
jgi:plastocyanin